MDKKTKKEIDKLNEQIQNKKEKIESLQYELIQLENKAERYKTGEFGDILEKANSILKNYYLKFISTTGDLYVGYCYDAVEKYDGVEIIYKDTRISLHDDFIYYSDKNTYKVINKGYFDCIIPITNEDAKEIQNEIDKTIHGEKTIKELYKYLKNLYRNIYDNNSVNTEYCGMC